MNLIQKFFKGKSPHEQGIAQSRIEYTKKLEATKKRYVKALETIDFIKKGKEYELIECEPNGFYIKDESGETSYYHISSCALV